jgi:hypothetical protein
MKTYKQQILQHRQDESNAERRCPINKKTKMQKFNIDVSDVTFTLSRSPICLPRQFWRMRRQYSYLFVVSIRKQIRPTP